MLTPEEIARLFARLAEVNPAPRTELAYADPFTLLVAVVLSAQATDLGVNKATRALFAAAPTPAAMVALGEDRIREHIKTIGLFRNKAKNVLALSQALLERHDGQVPRARAALEALPGRRAQDRQCRAERGLRRADDRGRHPCLSRRQPDGPGAGEVARGGGGHAAARRAAAVQARARITG